MKKILIALTILFLGAGTAATADINEYKGTWINTDSNTREITKIVIEIVGGGKANAHAWGQCSPEDCDLGWANCNSYADGHLTARYQNDFSVRDFTINKTGTNMLEVKVHTRFTDDSGRPTRDVTETFRRLLTPATQTPKTINRLNVKPSSE